MVLVITITKQIIIATTTMRMGNIIIISLPIEAMNRTMTILIITLPVTITQTNTKRNQTKSQRNTCTKYMSQHSATTHP